MIIDSPPKIRVRLPQTVARFVAGITTEKAGVFDGLLHLPGNGFSDFVTMELETVAGEKVRGGFR